MKIGRNKRINNASGKVWRPALLLAITLLTSYASLAEDIAGFGLNTTRVVAMADSHRGTVVIAENNTDNLYLVQSRIYPPDGVTGYPRYDAIGSGSPFIVTPPLKRLEAQGQLPLRILVTPDSHLPQDRESLFFLAAKAIPAISELPGRNDSSSPRIVLALQQVIKLYYRPPGLKPRAISDGEVAPALRMTIVDGALQVINPTPYYIAFYSLSVNGRKLAGEGLRSLTPPKGRQSYSLAARHGDRVEWQVIDEFGLGSAVQTQVL